MTTLRDQPPPVHRADAPAVWDLVLADAALLFEGYPGGEMVLADMRERDAVGRARYGTPLQPGNGRDALVDAYQEALDCAVYLRQALEEHGQPAVALVDSIYRDVLYQIGRLRRLIAERQEPTLRGTP